MTRKQLEQGKLRIFVSSPGDVSVERRIARRVIERLQVEFEGRVELDPVFWEYLPMRATDTFQPQIPLASEAHVALFILWSRLGTPLPSDTFARDDGTPYASGTEFEFEKAMAAHRSRNIPDILTYRKVAEPVVGLDLPEDELQARKQQRNAVQAFLDKWFLGGQDGTLSAAFTDFVSPEEFEEKLEEHLRHLIREYLPEDATRPKKPSLEPVWKQGSPFRGLQAFDTRHEQIFCGRTAAVHDVVQAITRQHARRRPFTAVLGMSGSGKSSLVLAGVLPVLTELGVVEGVSAWQCSVFRPSDADASLFRGLASALLTDHLTGQEAQSLQVESLATMLEHNPQVAASNVIERLDELGDNAQQVLVVDQLEELFTTDNLADQAPGFINALSALVDTRRVWVIATLRSDFYDRTAKLPNLVQLMEGDGQYHLLPPTAAEIGRMIRQPAALAGLEFERDDDQRGNLDDVLRDAAMADPNALPLLEFTLDELFQRRTEEGLLTYDAYDDLGGVEGALATRAESVFLDLPQAARDTLPSVLRAMTTISEAETLTRRHAVHAELSGQAQQQLVEAFVQARLFVADENGVRVAHEALLTHWPRLVAWFDEDREFLKTRSRVAAAAARWSQEAQDPAFLLAAGKPLAEAEDLLEQRRAELPHDVIAYIEASQRAGRLRIENERRRNRQIITAIGSALAVALVLAVFSFVQYRAAETERQVADQQRGKAETAQGIAERERDNARRQKGIAERERDNAQRLKGVAERERSEAQTQRDNAQAALEKEKIALAQVDAARQKAEQLAVIQAELLEKIGKFGDILVSQEQLDDAQETFDAAEKVIERLLSEDPENPRLQHIAAMSQFNTGKVDWLKTSKPVIEEVVENDPYTQSRLGTGSPEDADRLERILAGHKSAVAYREKLLELKPEDDGNKVLLFDSYLRVAHTLVKMGRFDEVEAELDKAKQVSDGDGFAWMMRKIGMSTMRKGWDVMLKHPDRNEPDFKQDVRDKMPTMQPEMVINLATVALTFENMDRDDEALEVYALARAHADDFLAREETEDFKFLVGIGTLYYWAGEFYVDRDNPDDAMKCLPPALDLLQKAEKIRPGHEQTLETIASVYGELGYALLDQGKGEEALARFQDRLQTSEQLATKRSRDLELQNDVAYAHNSLGFAYDRLQRYDESLEEYRKGLEIRREILAKNPDDQDIQKGVAFNQRRIREIEKKLESP